MLDEAILSAVGGKTHLIMKWWMLICGSNSPTDWGRSMILHGTECKCLLRSGNYYFSLLKNHASSSFKETFDLISPFTFGGIRSGSPVSLSKEC